MHRTLDAESFVHCDGVSTIGKKIVTMTTFMFPYIQWILNNHKIEDDIDQDLTINNDLMRMPTWRGFCAKMCTIYLSIVSLLLSL